MRRMFSEKQIKKLARDEVESTDLNLGGDVSITGDLAVSGSINGEENPSLKPIYIHPITIVNFTSGQGNIRITCLIFNNSPTALTNATFKNELDRIKESSGGQIRIMASGGYETEIDNVSHYLPASYIFYSTTLEKYVAAFGGLSDSTYDLEALLSYTSTTFTDEVNKIN